MPIRGTSSIALRQKPHRRKWTKTKEPKIEPFAKEVDQKKREWKILSSYVGHTDKEKHVMSVPTDVSKKSESVRLHEQLHNRFSPEPAWVKANVDDHGIDRQIYGICEDLRLSYLANDRGVKQAEVIDRPSIRRGAKMAPRSESETRVMDSLKVALSLSGQGRSLATYLWNLRKEDKKFYGEIKGLLKTCRDYIEQSPSTSCDCGNCRVYDPKRPYDPAAASELADILTEKEKQEKKKSKESKEAEDAAREMMKKTRKEGKTSAGEMEAMSDEEAIGQALAYSEEGKLKEAMEFLMSGQPIKMYEDEGRSGDMKITTPPMPKRIYPKNREGQMKFSRDYGTVPSRIHNWCISKRVFDKKIKYTPGATILFDASGSMSRLINPKTIQDAINIAPGAKMAMYSGYGYYGELVVIADNGRACQREAYRFHGGNVVDLPAVNWLSKQPGPRYWVTDLGVTGIGDGGSIPLRTMCLAICAKAKIKVVRNIPDLLDAMRITITEAPSDSPEDM